MARAPVFVERVPRPEFAAMFVAGGALYGIVRLVRESNGLLDLDFWVDSRAKLERASVYCGLAKLVDIYAGSGRRLRVEATGLTRRRLSLPDEQASWIREEDHSALSADVVSLIDRAVPVLPESQTRAGRTLLSGGGRTVLARSFGPRFDDGSRGAPWLADITVRLRGALLDVGGIPRNLPPKPSCDALMIDQSGNLLLVDAEAPRSAEVGFAPARASHHLSLWDAWVALDPDALSQLRAIARLREGLGLCPAGTADLVPSSGRPRSTFVLVTEVSVSAALLARMARATGALADTGLLDATRFRYQLASPDESGITTGSDATR